MNVWMMNEWINESINEWMNESMNEWINKSINESKKVGGKESSCNLPSTISRQATESPATLPKAQALYTKKNEKD